MAFNCIQIREPNYRDSLLVEPISPEPDMSCRPVIDYKSTLMALNENYEKYLNSLPQKQKEYHNLVMAARQSANYPIKQLSAPLLLAKQQTSLIEEQFKQQFLNKPSKSHPLPAFGQIIKTSAQIMKPQINLERIQCKTTFNPNNYQNYNRIQYNPNFSPNINPNLQPNRNPNLQTSNAIISREVIPQNQIVSRNYSQNYNNYRSLALPSNISVNSSPTVIRNSTPTNRNINPSLAQNSFNSNRNPTLTQNPNIVSNFNRTYDPIAQSQMCRNVNQMNNNERQKFIVQRFPNFCCNQSCCPTIQLLNQPEKRIPEMMPISVIQMKPIVQKKVTVKELLEKKKPIIQPIVQPFKPKIQTNILKQRLLTEDMPLNLKKKCVEQDNSDDDCLIIEHFKRQDSDCSSVNLRISVTPEIQNKKSEEKESEEEFYERLNNLLLQLLRKNVIETTIIDTIDDNNQVIDNRFEYNFRVDIQELARILNLIKTRDLSRKPIAYLNSRYPLNDISRSIYAGIATKKSVLDFPTKRKILKEDISAKKKIKIFEKKDVEEYEDKNNWNFVLKSLDFSSPLSQRIIGVLPQFQYK